MFLPPRSATTLIILDNDTNAGDASGTNGRN